MAENSSIEWTTHTFNAWLGCDKVSPACLFCYITRTPALRFRGMKHGDPRQRTADSTWEQPLAWNRKAAREGVRPRVFTNSLADWLDDQVPIKWLADLLDLIRRTPRLDWLLLTKRPQNWRQRVSAALENLILRAPVDDCVWIADWLGIKFRGAVNPVTPANVWLGTTVEDQTRANERITSLLSIPARVHFLSCEPLLGPVDLRPWLPMCREFGCTAPHLTVDWVIAGGESGDAKDNVRPSHPDWFRSLRDQCQVAGVPFFFKQWGDWVKQDGRLRRVDFEHRWVALDGQRLPDKSECSAAARGEELATRHAGLMMRVGKKEGGRLLDGREHNEFSTTAFPQSAAA